MTSNLGVAGESDIVSLPRLTLIERAVQRLRSRYLGRLAYMYLKLRSVEIPRSVQLGRGIRLPHGAVGLVIHPHSRIGDNVKLYQGVTLGRGDTYLPDSRTQPGGGILVEDDAVIGANAVVLFRSGELVSIGKGAVIGAGSVVTRSVPAGEIWAGSPAQKIRATTDE